MTVEVTVLALAGLLAAVQLLLYAIPANLHIGSSYLAGPRDAGVTLTGRTARLQRAFNNHMENLVLFAVAVAVVTFSDRASLGTAIAAVAYLAARVLYVPLYAFGVPYLRSLVWAVGWFATLFMLLAALLA
ncbi:MAG: MAPEG family protein [Pseudomonadota bacterium]